MRTALMREKPAVPATLTRAQAKRRTLLEDQARNPHVERYILCSARGSASRVIGGGLAVPYYCAPALAAVAARKIATAGRVIDRSARCAARSSPIQGRGCRFRVVRLAGR